MKNVLICGLGAVGLTYAVKWKKHPDKCNLKILVDKERLERYSARKPVFNGEILEFDYILPDGRDFSADLIIIATKFQGLESAIDNIKNFVTPDTRIISLLNGVSSEEIISRRYPEARVLKSYFIGHSAIRCGNKITHDDVNTIVFGSDKNINENVLRVKKYFDTAGINYKIPDDIKHSLWLKYMLNVCANQTTAILRMTFGEMLENKHFMQLAVNIMKEVQAVAKAEGVNNTETMIDETLENLSRMLPEGKTSMLQDIEACRKTEVDMFAGAMIQFGKKHNIPTPYNCMIKEFIDIIHENQDHKTNRNFISV